MSLENACDSLLRWYGASRGTSTRLVLDGMQYAKRCTRSTMYHVVCILTMYNVLTLHPQHPHFLGQGCLVRRIQCSICASPSNCLWWHSRSILRSLWVVSHWRSVSWLQLSIHGWLCRSRLLFTRDCHVVDGAQGAIPQSNHDSQRQSWESSNYTSVSLTFMLLCLLMSLVFIHMYVMSSLISHNFSSHVALNNKPSQLRVLRRMSS